MTITTHILLIAHFKVNYTVVPCIRPWRSNPGSHVCLMFSPAVVLHIFWPCDLGHCTFNLKLIIALLTSELHDTYTTFHQIWIFYDHLLLKYKPFCIWALQGIATSIFNLNITFSPNPNFLRFSIVENFTDRNETHTPHIMTPLYQDLVITNMANITQY